MAIFVTWIAFIFLEKKNLNLIEKYGNKDFCNDVMSYEDTKILELNQYQTSYTKIYLIKRIDECKCDSEKSSSKKVG